MSPFKLDNMKRTIFSRVFASAFMMCLPFVFAWTLVLGTGFVIEPETVFSSTVYWILSTVYWFGWMFWQIESAVKRDKQRREAQAMAREAVNKLMDSLSTQQKQGQHPKEDFETLIRRVNRLRQN